ncbi:hypothetical protein GCM10028799_41560 [Kribbella italica]
MGTACAVLVLATGCGRTGSGPAAESSPPAAIPTVATTAPGDDVTVTAQPGDQVLLTKSGSTAGSTPFSGRFGPEYSLYARCRGEGAMTVTGLGDEPWTATCDGIPTQLTVLTDDRVVNLRLTTVTGTRWSFVVARSKSASAG